MINQEELLNYFRENMYLVIIAFVVGLIVSVWELMYIMRHRHSDFFYSGHSYVWYDCSTTRLAIAFILFIIGFFMAGASGYLLTIL